MSNSNNEVFKSPDSQDFKTETELSKKGSLTQKNESGVSYAGTLTGAFNLMTDNNSLYLSLIHIWEFESHLGVRRW